MPRQARLDGPGTLHHVMVRGIERRRIFHIDADREDFVGRLANMATAAGVIVYAWALIPNHAHLLVRTGTRLLGRVMRSFLTGYAGAFNRRHKRSGHLFQNRYKSIVVEEESYLLELVRYLHLNPLRAGVVPDLRGLDRYPWTGHSALLGSVPRPWQATKTIIQQFGPTIRRARAAYRAFVAAGIAQGRRPELQGGGLVRSLGGWAVVKSLRRGREHYLGDERILGSTEFVEQLLRDVMRVHTSAPRGMSLDTLVARVYRHLGLNPAHLAVGGRSRAVTRARAGIAYWWSEGLGHSGRALAPVLGISPQAVYQAVARGRAGAAEWKRLLKNVT